MNLQQFNQRLKDLADHPPKAPVIRSTFGKVNRQTAQSRARAVQAARRQIADEVRRRLLG